ncbi:MAG: hypothetical protein AAGA09_02435 [Pseudomonadota bacterium]
MIFPENEELTVNFAGVFSMPRHCENQHLASNLIRPAAMAIVSADEARVKGARRIGGDRQMDEHLSYGERDEDRQDDEDRPHPLIIYFSAALTVMTFVQIARDRTEGPFTPYIVIGYVEAFVVCAISFLLFIAGGAWLYEKATDKEIEHAPRIVAIPLYFSSIISAALCSAPRFFLAC